MSEQADSDSLRVEGSSKAKGKGTESIYQLLEVQTEVHHQPKGGGHEGGAGAAAKEQAERAVEDAIAEVKRLEGKLQRVQEQAVLVQKYTEGIFIVSLFLSTVLCSFDMFKLINVQFKCA
jgi:hypothetical protein